MVVTFSILYNTASELDLVILKFYKGPQFFCSSG